MDGTRHHSTRATGALALGLLSGSVLLALVLGGAVARADSSGIQYSDAPPTVTGENPSTGGKAAPARSSQADGGATAANPSGAPGSQSSGGKSSAGNRSSSQGDTPTTDNDGGTGQSSRDGGSTGKPAVGQDESHSLQPSSSTADDDGGSSPLLPILIAILVLAAVSIAVVLVRARRQADGSGQPSAPPRAS